MKKTLLGLTLLLALWVVPGLAHAQGNAGLKVTPALIEERLDPGKTYTFKLKVENLADSPVDVTALARDITGMNDGGQPIFATDEQEKTVYELSSWIAFPVSSFTLPARGSREHSFTVTTPADPAPGSHFGGVFFSVGAQKADIEGAGAVVGYQVGTIVSMRMPGDIVEDAAIRSFTSDKFIYNSPSAVFTTRIENKGNVLLRPHGFIDITDMRGKKVGQALVNESGAGVFPLLEREFTSEWASDSFALGRYQATLSIVYGEDERKTIEATVSFWVLPMKLVGGILGGLLALILVIWFWMRSVVNKKVRQMAQLTGAAVPAGARLNRGGSVPSKFTVIAIALLLFAMFFFVLLFFLFA